jgi:hypothetical protein
MNEPYKRLAAETQRNTEGAQRDRYDNIKN